MEASTARFKPLAASMKNFSRRLLTIAGNRLELLAVEVQEEREHVLRALVMAFGVAVFGLLAGLTLTAAIVVWLWTWSPVIVLLILTALYGAAGLWLYLRLCRRWREWRTLSATFEQIRKDRECLDELLK